MPFIQPLIRLNKYIADAGVCSRREADKLIVSGTIKVNGEVIKELGKKVNLNDKIEYKGKLLTQEKLQYILLNKPKDFETDPADTKSKKNVMRLVEGACLEKIKPIDGLEMGFSGLLVFTNDLDLINRINNASSRLNIKYSVELNKAMPSAYLTELMSGIQLEEGIFKFALVNYGDAGKNNRKLLITTKLGNSRVVKRMLEYFDLNVISFDRIQFLELKKGSLTRGKWRFLSNKEIGFLKMIKAYE